MPIQYAIADWDTVYETASTRKLKHLHWVPVPNKQDGRAYCCIMAEADGLAILGAWLVLLEVASKMPIRGVLADSRGPLSVRDIAVKSRASMAGIQRALDVLSSPEIGWIEKVADFAPALGESANGRPKSANIDPGIEQNRTEQNRRKEKSNFERASGRSTATEERPPARPQGDTGTDTGATVSAGATPASEHGERVRPERALVQSVWLAMQERFPRVDRGMARKVAASAKATASEIGISDEQLAKWITEIIRSASTRGYMRGPGMYLHTVPEEIRESEELMKTELPVTQRAQLPIRPDTSKPTCAECHGTGIVPNKAKAGLAEWPQTLSDQIRAVQAGECRYCFCHCGRTASQIHGAAA